MTALTASRLLGRGFRLLFAEDRARPKQHFVDTSHAALHPLQLIVGRCGSGRVQRTFVVVGYPSCSCNFFIAERVITVGCCGWQLRMMQGGGAHTFVRLCRHRIIVSAFLLGLDFILLHDLLGNISIRLRS